MRPFGHALQYSLENARIDNENPDYALWVEEDYCSPPLAMERESVLDHYFNDIAVFANRRRPAISLFLLQIYIEAIKEVPTYEGS